MEISAYFPKKEWCSEYWIYARSEVSDEADLTSWETIECFHRDWSQTKVKFNFYKTQSLLLHQHTGFDGLNYSSFEQLKELYICKHGLANHDWKVITDRIRQVPSKQLSRIYIETDKIEELNLV